MARNDPLTGFGFLLEIDGDTQAGFSEASGVNSETDVIEYREGADAPWPRKLPGLHKAGAITLQWGETVEGTIIWDWRKSVLDGEVERKNGALILLDESGQPAVRFEFDEGWPSKAEAPNGNATASEVAISKVEIQCENIRRVQ